MANISKATKKNNGNWSQRIRFYHSKRTPTTVSVTVNHPSKLKLSALVEELIELYNSGEYDPWNDCINTNIVSRQNNPDQYLFSDATQQYLQHIAKTKGVKDSTIHKYKEQFTAITNKIGNIPIQDLNKELLNQLFQEWKINYKTAANYIMALRLFFKWANIDIKITNPKNKQKPTIKYLTRDDITQLKKTIIKDAKARVGQRYNHLHYIRIIEFMFLTGFRRGEVVNMKVKDIDPKNKVIFLPQTKANEEEYLHYDNFKALELIINAQFRRLKRQNKLHPESHFFLIKNAKNLSGNIKRFIRETFPSQRAENLRMHSIRHGTATHLYNKGVDIQFIQQYLRHKSINTTSIYAKVLKKEAVDRIRNVFDNQ